MLSDPAAALFPGLAVLPKKSALTDHSYRTSHDHQRGFLAAPDQRMIAGGLATGEQAIVDLDFHAVMHWGHDPAVEKQDVDVSSSRPVPVSGFDSLVGCSHIGSAKVPSVSTRIVASVRPTKRSSGLTRPSGHTVVMPFAPRLHELFGALGCQQDPPLASNA